MTDLKIGDKVIKNDKYHVLKKDKGVVFTVNSKPWQIRGTECIRLENHSGGYPCDGLTKVEGKK